MANFTTVFKTKNNSPIPTSVDNDPQKFLLGNSIIGDFNTITTDNSGQGALSSAEKNQTYFTYFNGVGGTGPEIIDQTAYFIKYLIDSQGNVVTPQANSTSLLNLNQNFEKGKIVNVTSLDSTTLFTTLLGNKITTGVGKIETIAVTETSSGRMDYVTTMSFGASYLATSLETAYDYRFQAKKAQSAYISNNTYATLDFGTEISDSGSNYNTSTYIYTFPNNTSDQGTQVVFKTIILIQNPDDDSESNVFYVTIEKSTDGGTNWSPLILDNNNTYKAYPIPSTNSGINLNNIGGLTQAYAGIFSNLSNRIVPTITTTLPQNFNNGDKIRVRYKLDNNSLAAQCKIMALDGGYSTTFSNTQTYVATNYITSSYWSIGTWSTNPSIEYSVITASKALTGLYSDQFTQLMPTASTTFGFSTITQPFQPQPGDFIRFEYDKSKVHTIYEVGTADTGSGTNISGSLILKVRPGIQTGSLLDHFCIYRVIPNGNYVILDVKKPSGTTGQPLTGFIKPQYISKELEDNFETIISKLNAEGTLS